MPKWFLQSVQISGGFLAGLDVTFPVGLTCFIGPRGSGKSTLAEAIRFCIAGALGAPKARLDLIQANLGTAVITIRTAESTGEASYTIRRAHREPASLVGPDGKPVASVDLERGTFLPLDAYGSAEIEAIADESLGARRRALLDELRSDELHRINLSVAEKRRALDANADAIRSADRLVADLTERTEAMGGARARVAALPASERTDTSDALVSAARRRQANLDEAQTLSTTLDDLAEHRAQIAKLANATPSIALSAVFPTSADRDVMASANDIVANAVREVTGTLRAAEDRIGRAERELQTIRERLSEAHRAQDAVYAGLQAADQAAGETVRLRQEAERAVAQLEALEAHLVQARTALVARREERKALTGSYLLERENVSAVREDVASTLQADAGGKVRVRVLRNADSLAYRSMLTEGLKGARVKNHEEILDCMMRLRPEQLAQIIAEQDVAEFEHLSSIGGERCRRILEAYRANIDPFVLEVVGTDDRVCIELNVSTGGSPNYKDAAELSRGQKCTALLPLLLARRDTPLLIDQPEDNLDNHFIYETVVDSIRQLRPRRQMIFITHNANIPVLAEADLIVVMNSDGKVGYVERSGTLDECRDEIVDLLEGGNEAFELRRRRYQRGR